MTAASEKMALRDEALRRRSLIAPALRHRLADELVTVGLAAVRGFDASGGAVVSAYHPIRDEADPLPLLAALATAGSPTALPAMVARARPLRFLAWAPGDPLRRAGFGVREPLADAPERVPDVLFVPLAAFDGHGTRLGYGAGFYDATLRALRQQKRVLAVGVGFAVQEVAHLPAEPHDERLDAVATEHGLRVFGAG